MIYLGCVLLPVTVPALIPVLGNNLRLELSCNHVFGSKALSRFGASVRAVTSSQPVSQRTPGPKAGFLSTRRYIIPALLGVPCILRFLMCQHPTRL